MAHRQVLEERTTHLDDQQDGSEPAVVIVVKDRYTNGDEYEGEILLPPKQHDNGSTIGQTAGSGRKHGYGIYRFAASGATYSGEWHMGRMHGWGSFEESTPADTDPTYSASGDRYEGHWENGKRVFGIYSFAESGDMYQGGFSENMKHGRAIVWEDRKMYEAIYEFDELVSKIPFDASMPSSLPNSQQNENRNSNGRAASSPKEALPSDYHGTATETQTEAVSCRRYDDRSMQAGAGHPTQVDSIGIMTSPLSCSDRQPQQRIKSSSRADETNEGHTRPSAGLSSHHTTAGPPPYHHSHRAHTLYEEDVAVNEPPHLSRRVSLERVAAENRKRLQQEREAKERRDELAARARIRQEELERFRMEEREAIEARHRWQQQQQKESLQPPHTARHSGGSGSHQSSQQWRPSSGAASRTRTPSSGGANKSKPQQPQPAKQRRQTSPQTKHRNLVSLDEYEAALQFLRLQEVQRMKSPHKVRPSSVDSLPGAGKRRVQPQRHDAQPHPSGKRRNHSADHRSHGPFDTSPPKGNRGFRDGYRRTNEAEARANYRYYE